MFDVGEGRALAWAMRVPVHASPPPFALSLSKGLRAWHLGFDKLSPNGEGRALAWAMRVPIRTSTVRPELVEG
ncbi:MAG TPA: hypothetical protein VFL86_23750, partial [Burkholderiaceae bacterium]|nr:hypothetical protein [Burkholderiaceae bacterium]